MRLALCVAAPDKGTNAHAEYRATDNRLPPLLAALTLPAPVSADVRIWLQPISSLRSQSGGMLLGGLPSLPPGSGAHSQALGSIFTRTGEGVPAPTCSRFPTVVPGTGNQPAAVSTGSKDSPKPTPYMRCTYDSTLPAESQRNLCLQSENLRGPIPCLAAPREAPWQSGRECLDQLPSHIDGFNPQSHWTLVDVGVIGCCEQPISLDRVRRRIIHRD